MVILLYINRKNNYMLKINPFTPNLPVSHHMFVGRQEELNILQRCIMQTRANRPTNFLILGERGIGKTSLINYVRSIAKSEVVLHKTPIKFLVLQTEIINDTTIVGLLKKIQFALEYELQREDRLKEIFSKSFKFLKRIEISGIRLHEEKSEEDIDTLLEQFSYELADLSKKICTDPTNTDLFENKYEGIIILLDEADNAPKELQLGVIVKLLMERLHRHGCFRVMLGLAGLPSLHTKLFESHESSIRLFQTINLTRLTNEDISKVIDKCLDDSNKHLSKKIIIDDKAKSLLQTLSEGFPHFIQQYGYSAFEKDDDNFIDEADVSLGAFSKGGALESLGDRYYRSDFYNKIQQDSYRQVLLIMSEYYTNWVSKEQIRSKFSGSTSTLSNALRTLRLKNIILSKEGETGKYKLQHVAFALWIKHQSNFKNKT